VIDTVALREKVLDLAIRGKLVPQDPNDEPASVLLERIRAQKQQMVKDGKLKAKDIKDDSIIFVGEDNLHYEKFANGTIKCIEDEIPFELPEGWAWVRFGTFTINRDSERKPVSSSSRKNVEKKYDYYGASGKIDKIDNYLFDEKLLLIGEDGANLVTRNKPIAFFADGQYWVNNHAHCIDATDKRFLNYLCYFINAIDLEPYVTGSAQPKMNQENMNSILISLPPFDEQLRILNQVDSFYELISGLENDQQSLSDIIGLAKNRILDLAICGKLVPQNPDDEPASVMLERIRIEKEELIKAGKIKRDKKESVIFKGEDNSYYEKFDDGEIKCIDEDVPFELPESWCWCRLGTLFAHNTGKALNSSDSAGTLMTYITTSNLYWDRFELDSLKEMPFTESEIDKCTVTKGDLLVCEGGDIGRSAIWMFDNDIRIQNHIHRLRPYISLSNRFYYYVLYMWKQMGLIGGQGIGLQGFSSKALHNLIVPLPPIKAQETIVAFVDEINHKLTSIENSLT
jgi:type I restriction enzyme S subunit